MEKGTEVYVDGVPLVLFHFQGLERLVDCFYDTSLSLYNARLTPLLRERVYRPYLDILHESEQAIKALMVDFTGNSVRKIGVYKEIGKIAPGLAWFLEKAWKAARALRTRTYIYCNG